MAATGSVALLCAATASAATINVDASKQTAGNPHFWSSTVGTGTAGLALRGDLQTHYKIGNREAGFQQVRGHGVMDNTDIGMYKGAGNFDFSKFDTYLSAIKLAGMRPIMELSFFPAGISSKRAPISDYTNWKAYVTAVAKHCVEKLGAEEVGKWYWEVWNEPDYSGFWEGVDMNKYYTLYDNTVDGLTAVLPNVLVGGPATSMNTPVGDFLKHCKSAGKRVTFVSSHTYPGGDAKGTNADPAVLVSDNDARLNAIKGAGYSTSDVRSFNTEWNSSYNGQGGLTGNAVTSMDNHWNVGFIVKAAKLLADKDSGDTPPLDVFSYWAISDVFDESSGPSGSYMLGRIEQPFGTVFGLLTVQGMRKAAFNAFKLLHFTGPKRLSVSGGSDSSGGINAMATSSASGDSLQILLYNYNNTLATASGSGDSQAISVTGLPAALAGKEIFVTTYVVDEKHSNPYSVWQSQSSPTKPSETQWQAMRAAQHLSVTTTKKTVDTTFSTTITMLKQSATLIILSTARPLMGRDAMVEIEAEDFDGQSGATKKDSGDSATLGQSLSLTSGGYVYFENVDYTDGGASGVDLRVKAASDTSLELHAETQTGKLLAKCSITAASSWATQNCKLSEVPTGVSKLYLVAGGAIELNHLKFQPSGVTPPPTGGTTGGNGGVTGGSGGATGGKGGTTSVGGGGAAGSAKGGAAGSGRGGAAGSAGGSAGSGAGGSGGTGPGGDTGSSETGGNTSGSTTGGSGGGNDPQGGSGGNSGTGGTTISSDVSASCGCRVGSTGSGSAGLFAFGLCAALIGLARQRSRRCR